MFVGLTAVYLLALFDIDFSSTISCSPHSAVLSLVDEAESGALLFHFRYMGIESVHSAERMVECLGKLMGTKNAAIFIDGCVADTFEAISSSLESHSSLSLHELVGLLIVARNVSWRLP